MGSSFVHSCASFGLDTSIVTVEADVASGLPACKIVGLPDAAVSEARDRVRAAMKNSGFTFPRTRVTINLAPADLKKYGPSYDLPIAMSLLLATGLIPHQAQLERAILIGELALGGELRPIKGALLAAMRAKEDGFDRAILAPSNAPEAGLISELRISPMRSLKELAEYCLARKPLPEYIRVPQRSTRVRCSADMEHVKGQEYAKRALEIAAAGGHNILLTGPPGSGKTMLARAAASILPPLLMREALEVTKVRSIAGLSNSRRPLAEVRPFRSPHHSSSSVALIGGGTWPKPGEVSLAHRGVLFLDEFPEFSRNSIENLRQPLEDGVVTIARAAGTLEFPARFMLIASMNPCPCGLLTDPDKTCLCTPGQITKYRRKISGPILDRIDLVVDVPRVDVEKLTSLAPGERSTAIRRRVSKARKKQTLRYKSKQIETNTELESRDLKKYCALSKKAAELLKQAVRGFSLSARAYTRTIKVARTIADLAGKKNIEEAHIAEALQYRAQEREL